MGEIADMIIEGLLDEETGEYIGDINEQVFGEEAPGFPVSHRRKYIPVVRTDPCPICGKLCAPGGRPLAMHMKAKHPEN